VAIVLGRPGADGLSEVVGVLREWQYEGAPMLERLDPEVHGAEDRVLAELGGRDRREFLRLLAALG
jgi:hypothetical protein